MVNGRRSALLISLVLAAAGSVTCVFPATASASSPVRCPFREGRAVLLAPSATVVQGGELLCSYPENGGNPFAYNFYCAYNPSSGVLMDNEDGDCSGHSAGGGSLVVSAADGQAASVVVGSSIADTATVSGGAFPSGTVTFDLYDNPDGTGSPLFSDDEALSFFQPSVTSASYVTANAGTDYWVATYSGDGDNDGASSPNGAVPVAVTAINPSLSCPATDGDGFALGDSRASATLISCSYPAFPGEDFFDYYCTYDAHHGWLVTDHDGGSCATVSVGGVSQLAISVTPLQLSASAGDAIAASATVSGGDSPTGTVTFTLYKALNGGSDLAELVIDPSEPLSGGSSTSAGVVVDTGTYYWVATYNGDANNDSLSTPTGGGAPVTVTPAIAAITGISPASGPTLGGTQVIVTGKAFTGATSVLFGSGTPGTDLQVWSDTELMVTSPARAAGTVNVRVVAPTGKSAVVPAAEFVYRAPVPTVDLVSPAGGPPSGGTSVTVTGSGFIAGGTRVLFGGVSGSGVQVSSPTQLTVISPAHVVGTVKVQVVTAGGQSAISADRIYTFFSEVPALSLVSPSTGLPSGGTSVSVTGSGFVAGGTQVLFGGVLGSGVQVSSPSQLTVISPAHVVGTVDVRVVTAGGKSAVVAVDQFAYRVHPPVVSGVSPSTGLPNGGTSVTVTGTGFSGATSVSFGGAAGTGVQVVSDSQLTVLSPPHADGTVDVRVVTAGGESAVHAADQFVYRIPVPVVGGLSPSSGLPSGGTSVTVFGSGFTGAIVALFNGFPVAVQVVSDSQLTVISPSHVVGTVDVRVVTAGGESAVHAADRFVYRIPVPVVTAVSPSGDLPSGFTQVTVSGTGFTGATSVWFGGVAGALIEVVSDSQLIVLSPAHAKGTVDVRVVTAGGKSAVVAGDQFVYAPLAVPAPVVSAVSPGTGSPSGGTLVTVSGSALTTGTTSVLFDGVAGTNVLVVSGSQLTVLSPPHPKGTVDVRVVTAGGKSAVVPADQFVYRVPVPVVTSVSPNTGLPSGFVPVTVFGTGFRDTTSVLVGAVPALGFDPSPDGTEMNVFVPPHSAGTVNIKVTSPGGTSAVTAGDRYTYAFPTPAVTSVSPSIGSRLGGTQVTITGSDLGAVTSVSFGATQAVAFSVGCCNDITAFAPPHAIGTVDITVDSPGGTSPVVAGDQFTYAVVVPAITGVSPSAGTRLGGTPVTITGSGFLAVKSVLFGDGNPATTFVVISDTQITATAPPHAVGTVHITATSPDGTSPVSVADFYSYSVITPAVTSVSPGHGSSSGGRQVTITGSGFSGASQVLFGTDPATTFSVDSDSQITATSPPHAVGTVDITVGSVDATSPIVAADQYSYVLAAIAVTAVSPSTGSPSGGTPVTITGSGFSDVTQVMFGSTVTTKFSVDSDSQITVHGSPPHAAGTVDITVVSPDGTSPAVSGDQYDYVAVIPAITGVSPNTGSASGGDKVTITGTGFSGVNQLFFGSVVSFKFSVDSDTQITVFLTPQQAAGTVDITVASPDGTSPIVAADQFTYV